MATLTLNLITETIMENNYRGNLKRIQKKYFKREIQKHFHGGLKESFSETENL